MFSPSKPDQREVLAGGIYLGEHLLVSKALMRHAFIKKWKCGLWLPCVQSVKVSSSERTWHPVTSGGGGLGLGGVVFSVQVSSYEEAESH